MTRTTTTSWLYCSAIKVSWRVLFMALVVSGNVCYALLSVKFMSLPSSRCGGSWAMSLHHRRSSKSLGSEDDVETKFFDNSLVRFLGRGENAIVRPGCVLVAPSHEFHHFYQKAAIFIYAMGEDSKDPSRPYVIRGLIIDHPTPFTLAEMMEHNSQMMSNPLGQNFLFRGGDKGQDGVILLHNQHKLCGQPEIGTSGIYQGGWAEALQHCQNHADSSDTINNFKAFFNYCEFTEAELEDLLNSEEDGDAWVSVEVTPDFILNPDWDRGDAWTRLRNTLKQMNVF